MTVAPPVDGELHADGASGGSEGARTPYERAGSAPTGDGTHTAHCTVLTDTPTGQRNVLWLDIDNCLYSKRSGIAERMNVLIQAFFESIGLSQEEASSLHHRYYKQYGLSIRGLVRHHRVDPLAYNEACDQALPLEEILAPDPKLRQLLQSVNTARVRVCALTNAYKLHAVRVLRILGVDDLVELIVSCDYENPHFRCKPEPEFFREAMALVGTPDQPDRQWYVDDSALNVTGALDVGWTHSVLFDEDGTERARAGDRISPDLTIGSLQELRRIWATDVFLPPGAERP